MILLLAPLLTVAAGLVAWIVSELLSDRHGLRTELADGLVSTGEIHLQVVRASDGRPRAHH